MRFECLPIVQIPTGVPTCLTTSTFTWLLGSSTATAGSSWDKDDFSRSLVRILDIGGMIWESDERYATIDQALAAAEQALAEWIEKKYPSSDLAKKTSSK